MQIKNVLITALVGMVAVEASVIPGDSPYSKTLARRQFRGGNGRFGGGGGGGGNNNNNNNNGGNQNNNGGDQNNGGGQNNGGNNNGGQACLNPDLIQEGSNQGGNPQDGAVASVTDANNFINFCEGQDVTNGEQKTGGSCNGIPMGRIPAQNRMVSSILRNPVHNDNIEADTDFDIQVQVDNFAPGSFTDAQSTYYSAPQDLDGQGNIIGHTHITVQDLGGSLTPDQPLDASTFVFFKGINDAGNGNGLLSATVTGGLPAGNYRVCTMFAAANHQPVLMPVAQRGAQDDCNKFTVGGNNNNGGGGGGNNNGGGDQAQGDQNQGDQNQGDQNQGDQNQGDQNQGDQNQGDQNQGDQNQGDQNQGDQNQGNNGGNNNQGGSGGGSGGASAANALGGIAAPEITESGNGDRPFEVNGNTFTDRGAAAQRACDVQNNQCFNAVNGGSADGFAQADCQAQIASCVAELS